MTFTCLSRFAPASHRRLQRLSPLATAERTFVRLITTEAQPHHPPESQHTMTSPVLRIEALPPEASHDAATMQTLTDLVNDVYATAEQGLWLPGTTRTDVAEMTESTRAGEIVVARWGDDLVGSIRVRRLDTDTAETGMLVAHPGHRNLGVGRQLRRHVTAMLRQAGVKTLQIELLVPRDWTPEPKAFMARWNERSGYAVVRKGAFDDMYPELAPKLATPCDFIIYEKAL